MKTIIECLNDNRPNISASSVKTYSSILRSLYYKYEGKTNDIDCKWFSKQDDIIELLKDKPASSRRTTYAALIAVTNDNSKYKKALLEDGRTYQTFIETQTKTQSQEDHWKSFDEIKTIYEDMYAKNKKLLTKKELDTSDLLALQDFILLALTSGYWIPPRRSSDWTFFKIKNIDKEHDNYMDKNEFVFNTYKTSKFYNTQKVEIPKGLKDILNKWIKLNPYDTLLIDNSTKPLSPPRLTLRLNKIFDGKISTSMLRHIYLSDKLKDVPALNALQKQASDMGNSVAQTLEYVKK